MTHLDKFWDETDKFIQNTTLETFDALTIRSFAKATYIKGMGVGLKQAYENILKELETIPVLQPGQPYDVLLTKLEAVRANIRTISGLELEQANAGHDSKTGQ